MAYVHRTVWNGAIVLSAELADSRFWSRQEILDSIGKGIFTPNFEGEAASFLA